MSRRSSTHSAQAPDIASRAVRTPSKAALQARALSVSFGKLAAVQDLDLTLARGERHALIGPNGAGKTTVINLLTGTLIPDHGTVLLGGTDVTRRGMDERARCGLVRTFQVNNLFPELTVLLSLVLVICERDGRAIRWWSALRRQKAAFDEAAYWLDRMDLVDVGDVRVDHLTYGHQRLLEIALALACRPRVLLLDEPAAGLPAYQSRAMLNVINRLPDDISVMLIEHDMNLVFGFAQTISVLNQGQVVARGTPEQIAADRLVRAIYLGPG